MRDILTDIVRQTKGLFEIIKITGTDVATRIQSVDTEKTMYLEASLTTPQPDLIGEFGISDLAMLDGLLGHASYKVDQATFGVQRETKMIHGAAGEAAQTAETVTAFVFTDANGIGKSRHATMASHMVPVQATIKDIPWTIKDMTVSKSNYGEFKRLCTLFSNVDKSFTMETTPDHDLVFTIGDNNGSTHSTTMVFESGVTGHLNKVMKFDNKQFQNIIEIAGNGPVMINIADKGIIGVSSQSRLLDAYLYTLPQAKTPFRRIRKSMHNGTFDELLFNSRLGRYGLLKTCFYHLVGFDGTDYVPSLNVETCTLDDLQAVYGSFGLVGKVYQEAEAYYELDGEDLARRLAEIAYADDPKALKTKLLSIDLVYGKIDVYEHDIKLLEIDGHHNDKRAVAGIDRKHGKLTEYDYDVLIAELDYPNDNLEREHALLDIQAKHGKITKIAYEKKQATLDEKPWIGIVDQGIDLEMGVNGVYFEFDWNSYWIDYLRLNGYVGHSEEELVEKWFQDVCRATAAANPVADDENAVAPHPVAGRYHRTANRYRKDDGSGTFYS
ncbi:unnamed protein product [Sphagnum tenellum]